MGLHKLTNDPEPPRLSKQLQLGDCELLVEFSQIQVDYHFNVISHMANYNMQQSLLVCGV
jgi:hypothetical protein